MLPHNTFTPTLSFVSECSPTPTNTPSRCRQCRHVYPSFPYNIELSFPVSLLPAMLVCASCPQPSTRKHNSILRGEDRQWQWGSSPQVQLLAGVGGGASRGPTVQGTGSSSVGQCPLRVMSNQSTNQSANH
ncbi:hypothetical protein mRhiFer1_008008 [Rhinolophus ferrumequinum]|uniref:Uncharacterized protein n=1 Tax=Rhinolophus ferrumequinum TaxID=59479 RepID=A0A7J7WQR9_RHIFE|nr:hypothetical protein mRhiFer1_008008 [Rhinolophus ferrumequinum]